MSMLTGAEVAAGHVTKTYPLNSRRLKAETVNRIAKALGLPTNASSAETMQLIEGRLGEDYEPRNVQVDLMEVAPGAFAIKLRSADGVITEIPAEDSLSDSDADGEHGGEDRGPEHEVEEEEKGGGAHEDEPAALPSRERELIARVVDAEVELMFVRDRARKLETELEQMQETRQRLQDQLRDEVSQLSDQVRDDKEKYRTLWRLNCAQLAEYDEALAKKDEENHILRGKLGALETKMRSKVPSEHVDSARDTTSVSRTVSVGGGEPGEAVVPVPDPGRGPSHTSPRVSKRDVRSFHADDGGGPSRITTRTTSCEVLCPTPAVPEEGTRPADKARETTVRSTSASVSPGHGASGERTSRRGRAPPVDPFDGESDILFEDWVPGLFRAAEWNDWSEHETLIQLAGHLRGRALQEWGLLTAREKKSLEEVIAVMRSRLDPSSRTLPAQDFRHASQQEGESVADFIRRLEQLFKLAYGRDSMSKETHGTLLHGQLQEGLHYDIMKAPAVSVSHGYKELCLASRNEEKRLAELAKRRQYSKPSRTSLSAKNQCDQLRQGTKPQSETPKYNSEMRARA